MPYAAAVPLVCTGVNARFSIGDEEEELSEVQLGGTPAAAEVSAAQTLSPVNKQD